jgi:1,2-diacylglycerol 3-alpha-glucosyltransferase
MRRPGQSRKRYSMARVAVIFRRLGPYHHARLRASGRVMEVTGIELTGCDKVYAWDKVEGAEGFRRVSLFPEQDIETIPAKTFFGRLTQELTNANPEVVVVPGWSERGSLAALQWCASRQAPVVVMSESTEWDEKRSGWKEWVKSRVVRLCAAALAGGTPHADYLARLGMPAERIFLGYDAVDNDYFDTKADEIRKQKAESRKGLNLPENYFLASARFVEKKNLPRLIEAYARYRQLAAAADNGLQDNKTTGPSVVSSPRKAAEQPRGEQSSVVGGPCPVVSSPAVPWSLVLLGDGPLRETLNSQLSTLNLHDHVLLPGFKQYGELPAYYGLAGAFIHASTTEPWGLVVNEAMASGLPVLVSNRCGCATDLVQEEKNGFTFDPYAVEQLAQLMLKISAFNFPLSEFGLMSREIISAWGPERFAQGLQAAAEKAVEVGPKRASWIDHLLLSALLLR